MLPILLLVALGWLLAKKNILGTEAESNLIKLVFGVSLPAIVFVVVLQNGIKGILNLKFAIAYALSIIIVLVITCVIFKYWRRYNLSLQIMAGMNAAISNSGLVAMPILIGIFGDDGSLPATCMLIVSILLIIPVLIFILEYSQNKNEVQKIVIVRNALWQTISQPFILAAIVALIFSLFSIQVPKPILTFLNYLGEMTVPCALIALGLGLTKMKVIHFRTDIWIIALLNSVIKPIIALILIILFHLTTLYATALIVVSAAPTANTIYLIAGKYNCYKEETATITFLTTLFSIIALPCFLILLNLWL